MREEETHDRSTQGTGGCQEHEAEQRESFTQQETLQDKEEADTHSHTTCFVFITRWSPEGNCFKEEAASWLRLYPLTKLLPSKMTALLDSSTKSTLRLALFSLQAKAGKSGSIAQKDSLKLANQ